jgi:hypothetical protein
MNPWKPVGKLKVSEVKVLIKAIPELTRRAYDYVAEPSQRTD